MGQGSTVGWLLIVGGGVVLVEALRNLGSVRAAVASSPGGAASGGSGATGSVPAGSSGPGASSGSGAAAGAGAGGSRSTNVGGGGIPTTPVIGSWVNESQQWAQQHAGQIAPGGSAAGLAAALDAIVIGESNGYPQAVGDNGTSHGLIQLHAFPGCSDNPDVYTSLTASLNCGNGFFGNRILQTYNQFVSQGIDPLGNSTNFGRFWAQAQGASPSGTQALAGGVLATLRGLFAGGGGSAGQQPAAPTNVPAVAGST